MSATKTLTDFGHELRRWRDARRYSQLALAGVAEISQRHLSFLETGRSKPSREMVLHLGRVLDVPLRDQNHLLTAAGFSPEYSERSLDDPTLEDVRRTLSTVVEAHRHIPAYVVDRGWDLVLANSTALHLLAAAGVDLAPEIAANAMRAVLHPEGLRPIIVDWEHLATVVMHRLDAEVAARPFDDRLRSLADEARSYPGVAELPDAPPTPTSGDLILPMVLASPAGTLRLISMIATIGAAFDVTLEELRLETLLPADRPTETILKGLT